VSPGLPAEPVTGGNPEGYRPWWTMAGTYSLGHELTRENNQ
jgi:hypothetical protein